MIGGRAHLFPSAVILVAAVVFCGVVSAGDKPLLEKNHGMAPSLFRPAVDTKGHLTVDSTPVLPHLSISLGLMLDFGFKDRVAVEAPEEVYDRTSVDSYITTRLMFNLGLLDRLVVGIQLPVVIPAGDMYTLNDDGDNASQGWSSKGTFGDIAVHTKIHITRANLHLIGVGAVLQYELPSGKPELLSGDPGGAISAKLIFDIEPASRYRMALNVGGRYPFRARSENILNADGNNEVEGLSQSLFKYGPTLNFGLGQSFVLWPGLMDFVLEFYGNQLASEFGNGAYTSLEANVGFKFYIEENSYLTAGYAHGIPTGETDSGYGFQNMEHRMFLGFAFEPSMPDRDGDGISDANDSCPDEKEDRDGFEDSDGCPDLDNDKDGIPDDMDACPLVPEDFDGDRDEDGCPEDVPDPTSDRDSDRIMDPDDKCPDEPETYNGTDDDDGCPDKGDVELTNGVIKTFKKIYFEYNSDEIKQVSYDILDTVAEAIKNNPQITLIEIQGHADERGAERYNLNLTTRRAAAVREYLLKKGVGADRLRSMGYGEYCPVKQGNDEEAWEENRRVEFLVIEINNMPTGVEPACPRAVRKGVIPPKSNKK